MSGISRREFFQKAATSAAVMSLVAAHVARLKANPLGLPIGSQTYPHRSPSSGKNLVWIFRT